MRLMQIMAGARKGGAELFFERLVLALDRAGARKPQQHLLLRKGERARLMRAQGFQVDEFSFGAALDFLTRRRVKKSIEHFQPDIILSWMSRATDATPKSDAVLCARLGGYYNLKYFAHCDHLICNTEDIRRYVIAEGWPQDRAHVLPNFVPDPGKIFRDESTGPLRLLALGRLHENKGFDTLIVALTLVDDVSLSIAGEGPEERRLRQLVKTHGLEERVEFIGWQDNLTSLFRHADVLVCPSRHEPLGNVILDAWAHEVAVVAAAAQGPSQLIENGHNGLLVPLDDPASLANAIDQLAQSNSLRHSLAQAGRSSFERLFSEARVVSAYLDFFDRVKR